MRPQHESCPPREWAWLPYEIGSDRGFLREHPYCIHCGAVKNMGPDKARRMGFYANVLADVSKRRKLADVQIRLIMKSLEKIEDFEDTYTLSAKIQNEWFLEAVEKYTSLPREFIEEYL